MIFLAFILAFLLGALPFSVWIGLFVIGVDIREFGDGNPGATNVLCAGSKGGYAVALALDISKGVIPASLAHSVFHMSGWQLALICIAPILGHAYSPFLNWTGGKAIATSAGVWLGLGWPYFVIAVVALVIWSLLIKPSGYAVILTMVTIMIFLFWLDPGIGYDLIWYFQALLFIWKHRDDLRQCPMLALIRQPVSS